MKYVFIFFFIMSIWGCKNSNHKINESKIEVAPENKLKFAIIGSEEKPALAISGIISSPKSLKEILQKNKLDYARIQCNRVNEFRPFAYLKVKDEINVNNLFKYNFLLKICPEDDANSEYCIQNIEHFQKKIKSNLNCEVVLGGMAKESMIITNRFEIKNESILKAGEYLVE